MFSWRACDFTFFILSLLEDEAITPLFGFVDKRETIASQILTEKLVRFRYLVRFVVCFKRQAHRLFQSEFSTHCDLVLPLSAYIAWFT
jgi:hypothetical protein